MKLKNILLAGAGLLLLVMGAIGLVLPLWPTTPFVLAAAFCLSSLPNLHARVMKISFVNEYIRNYKDKKGLSPKTVATSLGFLWGMMLLSAFLIRTFWIIGVMALVGLAVTAHILWIAKPKKPQPRRTGKPCPTPQRKTRHDDGARAFERKGRFLL